VSPQRPTPRLAPCYGSAVPPNPRPDPDATMSDAQESAKCLSDYHAFAASHDAAVTASAVDDVRETLDKVTELRSWLDQYGEALQLRG
jgi:hypothetical protein